MIRLGRYALGGDKTAHETPRKFELPLLESARSIGENDRQHHRKSWQYWQ
jgi:hypothetical protein